MAQQSQAVATVRTESPIDRQVEDTMRAWHELQDNYDKVLAQCGQWETAYNRTEQENAMLRARIIELEQKAGYYQRHSTELATRLVDIDRVIQMALSDARMAGYRPPPAGQPRSQPQPAPQAPDRNGTSPTSPPDDGQEMPKFLKGPRKLEDEIADATRDITTPRKDDTP